MVFDASASAYVLYHRKVRPFFNNTTCIILLTAIVRLLLAPWVHFTPDFTSYVHISNEICSGGLLYRDVETVHAPLIDYTFAAMYFLCPWKESMPMVRLFLKIPLIVADCVCVFLIFKLAQNFWTKKKALRIALIYSLNPILIWNTAGGHYDSIPIAFILLTLYLLIQKRIPQAGITLGIGIMYKFFPVLVLLPGVFYLKKMREKVIFFVITVITCLAISLPFLIIAPRNFIDMIAFRASVNVSGLSMSHAVAMIVDQKRVVFYDINFQEQRWYYSIPLIYFNAIWVITTAIALTWLTWKMWKEEIGRQNYLLLKYSFLFLAVFVLLNKTIAPQYTLWIVPFCFLFDHSRKPNREIIILLCFFSGLYWLFGVLYGLKTKSYGLSIYARGTEDAGIVAKLFYKIYPFIAKLIPELLILWIIIVASILYVIVLGWYVIQVINDRTIKKEEVILSEKS